MTGVHPRQVYKIQNILQRGSEEVVTQAKQGTLSLKKAEDLVMQRPKAAAKASTARRRKHSPAPDPVALPAADPDAPLTLLQYWWHLTPPSHRVTFLARVDKIGADERTTHPLLQVAPRFVSHEVPLAEVAEAIALLHYASVHPIEFARALPVEQHAPRGGMPR